MGFSKQELTNIIKDGIEKALQNHVGVTVFAACNEGQTESFFVQATYKNGKWCYTRSDGTIIEEGVDFFVCA